MVEGCGTFRDPRHDALVVAVDRVQIELPAATRRLAARCETGRKRDGGLFTV
jgi:hypothetical protein